MKHPIYFLLLCLVAKQQLLLAQQLAISRDLAPPAFHTGSVFHSFSSSSSNNADYVNLNLRQFDGTTATLYMAYGPWDSPNATINKAGWEKLIDKLTANKKVIHGHVLVYPNTNLDLEWWQQQPNNMVEKRMYKYIDTIASSRRGKIWTWDVVNEVMGDNGDDMDQDGVRRVFWRGQPIKEYQAMGQSFIAKAFHRTHSRDPNALLLLTDYGFEEDDPTNNNDKSDRILRFVKKLRSQKVPIHGVGMQFHFSSIPGREPNYTRIALNFQRFRNAGFPIYITELDVVSYQTTTPATVNTADLQAAAARQALVYARVAKICLNEPACKCLFMWDDAEYNSRDPSTKYSWLHPLDDGDENTAPVYGFPSPFWDINPNKLSPKPAWYAMQNALANFTGVYRVTSLWKPASSYLTRYGTSTPSNEVGLYTLSSESNSWTSMKWRFERVDVGIYRIACTWGLTTGYLSRSGLQDPTTLEYSPDNTVYVEGLHPDWLSQQWYVQYLFDNQYRIVSRWGGDGTLTRLGRLDETGSYQATNQLHLAATTNSWTSQIWRLERVWSPADTKTPSDRFWL